ncbi:F-box/LRR-repeat protein 17-like [Mytilus trossulus]|uniref:F-box/LRR-repeat protein 17-like n=1 Tax=Mytilus trossulus TaxID=6551 RepID=UPI0030074E73
MDSDSDQPCKKRCTERDKVQSESADEGKVQVKATDAATCTMGTDSNANSNTCTENTDRGSRSQSPDEDDNMQGCHNNLQEVDEDSRSSSRSGSEEAPMPSDILVDWVTSQNISSFTKPSQPCRDVESMPSCSHDTRFSRNRSPANIVVDDTGEIIPVENLNSSSSDSDSSDNQIDSATCRSDRSESTFKIQPSRHTEMTLTFGGTGSRSNMTHTVLLGDGYNSRQSVKYVFNFRSMSDSATQTDSLNRETTINMINTAEDQNGSPYFLLKGDDSSNNADTQFQSSINRLPMNILLQIFKSLTMCELLCQASLVCKTWYNLCHDPDLWRSIDLSHQHRADDNVLSRLTSYSDRVTNINLEDTKILTSHGISLVCVKCKHLQKLKLTRCFSVENDVLMMVGTSCKNLQCLYLDGCYRISDQWTCSVGEGCQQLKELVLSRCSQMTDVGISRIAENCHNLENIILDHCNKVTDQSVRMLAENCPELKTLSLANCNITDTGICSIYRMKKLEYLDISNLPGGSITAAIVSQLTRKCDNLECLNLSLNLTIDDRCIQEVVRYGQKITKLFCVNCSLSDEGLMGIASHGRNIVKLDLGWCKDITDRGIWAVTENCPALKYLGLIRCDSVSEKGVEAMVDKYPHIQFSTFFMESRKLIQKAIANGFKFMAETEQNK